MPARRAFLQAFAGGLAAEPAPGRRRLPAERIALLRDIAQRWEHRLPQGSIPALRASEACAGHGVCASVCPTGALRRVEAPGVAGLEFDADDCFACGACVVVCPERALELEARRPGDVPTGPERITRHALRACARCGEEFAPREGADLCPACSKDEALFTSGFPARSEPT